MDMDHMAAAAVMDTAIMEVIMDTVTVMDTEEAMVAATEVDLDRSKTLMQILDFKYSLIM